MASICCWPAGHRVGPLVAALRQDREEVEDLVQRLLVIVERAGCRHPSRGSRRPSAGRTARGPGRRAPARDVRSGRGAALADVLPVEVDRCPAWCRRCRRGRAGSWSCRRRWRRSARRSRRRRRAGRGRGGSPSGRSRRAGSAQLEHHAWLLPQVGLDDAWVVRRPRCGSPERQRPRPRASPAAARDRAITAAMMCSTNMTVSPSACRSRSRSIIGARSAGTSPASTSSSRSSRGSGPARGPARDA